MILQASVIECVSDHSHGFNPVHFAITMLKNLGAILIFIMMLNKEQRLFIKPFKINMVVHVSGHLSAWAQTFARK